MRKVLLFSADAAEILSELRSQKVRVATMDLRIASIANTNEMTLLTSNSVDFDRSPNVSIEDWTSYTTRQPHAKESSVSSTVILEKRKAFIELVNLCFHFWEAVDLRWLVNGNERVPCLFVSRDQSNLKEVSQIRA